MTIEIEKATSPPSNKDGRITFSVVLEPGASWHTCMNIVPFMDGKRLDLQYRCRSFFPLFATR